MQRYRRHAHQRNLRRGRWGLPARSHDGQQWGWRKNTGDAQLRSPGSEQALLHLGAAGRCGQPVRCWHFLLWTTMYLDQRDFDSQLDLRPRHGWSAGPGHVHKYAKHSDDIHAVRSVDYYVREYTDYDPVAAFAVPDRQALGLRVRR